MANNAFDALFSRMLNHSFSQMVNGCLDAYALFQPTMEDWKLMISAQNEMIFEGNHLSARVDRACKKAIRESRWRLLETAAGKRVLEEIRRQGLSF